MCSQEYAEELRRRYEALVRAFLLATDWREDEDE